MQICNRVLHRWGWASADEFDWEDIDVPSASEPGKVHTVAYSPHGKTQSLCGCEGYEYRGYCSHIERAHQIVNCEWSNRAEVRELEGCPECGGTTSTIRPRK